MKCICDNYLFPLCTLEDVVERGEKTDLILQYTEEVMSNHNWREVHKCKYCGKLWAVEHPYDKYGPRKCTYYIKTDNIEEWLKKSLDLTGTLRTHGEDYQFYKGLWPEDGPQKCQEENCKRLKIKLSAFCVKHHFESVTKRWCPFE